MSVFLLILKKSVSFFLDISCTIPSGSGRNHIPVGHGVHLRASTRCAWRIIAQKTGAALSRVFDTPDPQKADKALFF